ncbi:MAG TPA: HAMP domain-containing sensor histidine kinase [Steroidobacteraceae bacterium]|nr:HAMP domain-containing sensor histidine kinase [Steroidobacteraceae bacterium]
MSTARNDPGILLDLEIEELRRRLQVAEEMHRAIVDDELDGFVVGRDDGERRVLLVGDAHRPFQLDAEAERERRRALEEADRHKNQFMAVLGHELRNPLASLVNGLEILRRSAALEPHARRALEVMSRQTTTLIRLADDLLDVNRLEKGMVSLDRRRIDLARVLGDAVESARPALEAKRHTVEIVSGPEPVWVDGDPVRLTQVVLNLLLNAARYTDAEGHIRLVLECSRRADAQCVAIVRVIDTGVGIEPDQIARVFEPFAQLGSCQGRSGAGLGLGLTICRRLVELHGGSINCRSDGARCGAEFIVELPALPA